METSATIDRTTRAIHMTIFLKRVSGPVTKDTIPIVNGTNVKNPTKPR